MRSVASTGAMIGRPERVTQRRPALGLPRLGQPRRAGEHVLIGRDDRDQGDRHVELSPDEPGEALERRVGPGRERRTGQMRASHVSSGGRETATDVPVSGRADHASLRMPADGDAGRSGIIARVVTTRRLWPFCGGGPGGRRSTAAGRQI
jgi:hypothetical protein